MQQGFSTCGQCHCSPNSHDDHHALPVLTNNLKSTVLTNTIAPSPPVAAGTSNAPKSAVGRYGEKDLYHCSEHCVNEHHHPNAANAVLTNIIAPSPPVAAGTSNAPKSAVGRYGEKDLYHCSGRCVDEHRHPNAANPVLTNIITPMLPTLC